jgi:hypothetical protein
VTQALPSVRGGQISKPKAFGAYKKNLLPVGRIKRNSEQIKIIFLELIFVNLAQGVRL